jgi:hypothetical protein
MVLAFVAGAANAQFAGVNGYRSDARIFNDFSTSSLTINGTNRPIQDSQALPAGPVIFQETIAPLTPGNFANKHVAWLSSDGGTTRATSSVGESWNLTFTVNLAATNNLPRKEAGIEIHQPRPGLGFTDEGQVLIASNDFGNPGSGLGEVAVFGATLPFTGFGPVYTPGTTATVSFSYAAPGTVDPTKGAYRLIFTDVGTGTHDSGWKVWGNEPDGIVGLTGAYVGLKAQNTRDPFTGEVITTAYNNVMIPAPGALALLGLGGLAAARRRRR